MSQTQGSGDLVAFLRARLGEDEAAAKEAGADQWERAGGGVYHAGANHPFGGTWTDSGPDDIGPEWGHIARHDPARALREAGTWRKIILEYAIPPGTDAVYGGTERETGFRLALSFALKAKAAEWSDHPDYQPE